jgi:hypothetical protein
MPRANAPNRTLNDVSVAELKAVLAGGDESATVAAALDQLTEANRVVAEHELDVTAYQAYVDRRNARHSEALAMAAAASDKTHQGHHDGTRLASRQAARLARDEEFAVREPLLRFADWAERGRPEIHQVSATRRVVEAVMSELVN